MQHKKRSNTLINYTNICLNSEDTVMINIFRIWSLALNIYVHIYAYYAV